MWGRQRLRAISRAGFRIVFLRGFLRRGRFRFEALLTSIPTKYLAIPAAHELATWMKANKAIFGHPNIFQNSDIAERYVIKGKKGVVYINNGWGSTDHIDLWDGKRLKAGSVSYLDRGNQLWFWEAK
ncbi:T6SS effector amidase Tae4 family protein [Microbulbifer sp. SA54]|uniref:T6SS effector amidase Tae4 family protein n=1 Tax=Microbulbifer sp. SA54 TaxID=3401577 RepID=UPI003AAA747A